MTDDRETPGPAQPPYGPPPTPPGGAPQPGAGSNVQLPWSEKGWYGDQRRAQRDPELERRIQESSPGMNPIGFRRDAPIRAAGRTMNNPYLNLISGVFACSFGVFLFVQVGPNVWGWLLLVVFVGMGLFILVHELIRVPRWHRARRIAREYIAEHGGQMPDELDVLS